MKTGREGNSRSKDFRIIYSNAFGIAFSDGEVQIVFGMQNNPGGEDPAMEEQMSIVLTHRSTKLLAKALDLAVKDFEETSGTVIPLQESKLAQLDTIFAAAKARRAEAKAAKEAKE